MKKILANDFAENEREVGCEGIIFLPQLSKEIIINGTRFVIVDERETNEEKRNDFIIINENKRSD